jgi:hypothetical protein
VRRDKNLLVLSVLGVNALVIAAFAVIIMGDVRDTAVLIGVVLLLLGAYLLRRWARSALLYRRDTDPADHPTGSGREPSGPTDEPVDSVHPGRQHADGSTDPSPHPR